METICSTIMSFLPADIAVSSQLTVKKSLRPLNSKSKWWFTIISSEGTLRTLDTEWHLIQSGNQLAAPKVPTSTQVKCAPNPSIKYCCGPPRSAIHWCLSSEQLHPEDPTSCTYTNFPSGTTSLTPHLQQRQFSAKPIHSST